MSKTILNQLLDKYAHLFDVTEDSNNYKFLNNIAYFLKDLDTQKLKVTLSSDIDRPLQLWRVQSQPLEYRINYRIVLPSIKRVRLYLEGTPPELLHDSGTLEEKTNLYDGSISFNNTGEIIPEDKYYLVVDDYHDHTLYKGFPENTTILGDKYDRDEALDVIGKFFMIPRRIHITDIDNEDLPNTIPPFCNSLNEWDYTYQERIKELMQYYQEKTLPEVEFYRLFNVWPSVTGRWRYLCAMNDTKMGDGMMMTEEWCPSVFDFTAVLEDIPPNIIAPNISEITDLLNRTIGISKRAYFSLIMATAAGNDLSIIADDIRLTIAAPPEGAIIEENYFCLVVGEWENPPTIISTERYNILIDFSFMTSEGIVIIPEKLDYYNPVANTADGEFCFGDLKAQYGFTASGVTIIGKPYNPGSVEPPEEWINLINFEGFGVTYDDLKVFAFQYYDSESEAVVNNVWVNHKTIDGTLKSIPPVNYAWNGKVSILIDSMWYKLNLHTAELTENVGMSNFVKELPNGLNLEEDKIIWGIEETTDPEYGSNYVTITDILNEGETVKDCLVPYNDENNHPIWVFLTNQRVIKCDWENTIISQINITGGLFFTTDIIDGDTGIHSTRIILNGQYRILQYDSGETTFILGELIELESFETLIDSNEIFPINMRLSSVELSAIGAFTGAIEAVWNGLGIQWYVLYANTVSVWSYVDNTWTEEEITLPESNAHHITYLNSFAPG